MIKKELLLICDCMCLDHIFHFIYYPPEKESDYEDNSIFIQMRSVNLYSRIMPPFNFYGWKDYIRFNYFKRFGIIFQYLFKIPFKEDFTIFDSFEFQIEDMSRIDEFLLNYKTKYNSIIKNTSKKNNIEIEDYKKRYKIVIKKTIDENTEQKYTIGYEIRFCDGNVWKRLKTSSNYLFFSGYSEEKYFEIEEIGDVSTLKSIVEDVFISNLKIENSVEDATEEIIKEINKD